jgi:hypothetical protein
VKPPWRVNGFVNQTLRNEQEGVENAAMIRGSVSIRSVSAMPVVACALNPQDESSSSSLTSTNVWVLTSFQLHTRKVAGSIPAGTTGVIIGVSGLKTPFGGPRIPLGNRRYGAKMGPNWRQLPPS